MESGSGEVSARSGGVSESCAGDARLRMAELDGDGADERWEMADSR